MNNTNDSVSRRGFFKVITGIVGSIMGLFIGLPAIGYILSPAARSKPLDAWIPVGTLDTYPIGEPKPFSFTRSIVNGWEKTVNSYGVFILRQDENQVQVFSNICTHLGCRVSWHPDQQHYISPCHDGHFDIIGNVVSGPPPRPLDEFKVKVEDGNLFIQFPPYKRS